MNEQKVNAGTRLAAMFLDHVIMTFAMMILAIPGMVATFSKAFNVGHDRPQASLFGNSVYIMLIGFAVYWCKDSINGRSPAKRILKLQVVDNTTGIAASPIKCWIRNIFLSFWPLEAIVALINPSRRIGDFVAGTKVVPFPAGTTEQKVNWKAVVISLALAYAVIGIPFYLMKSTLEGREVNYVENSFNESESRATEQLFADSLESELDADVRVYDKIENEDLKYVSVIFRIKESYLPSEEAFEQLKSKTIALTLIKFPEKTFIGRFRYVYRMGGSVQTRDVTLDWRDPVENE
jgi:uncharacterized RDD family membrane protein YckC